MITPRAQRRAVPAWRRFERYAPNDLWQIDGTQVLLTDGSVAWVIDILDDHARFAIGATAAGGSPPPRRGEPWKPPSPSMAPHGSSSATTGCSSSPATVTNPCTSNSAWPPWASASSAPDRHTHRRVASWSATTAPSRTSTIDHGPATTIDELQALCDRFRWHYNHQRPHQSLGQQLPAEIYQALPKVAPGDPRPRRRKTGPRVLIVSPQGSVHNRKRKIGIGMHWNGQQVTVIETTPDHVVVLDRTTGAVLRELTLGPVGTYHSNGRKRGRPRKDAQPPTTPLLSAMS